MTDDACALARQILEFGPTVMRTVSAELRQTDPYLAPPHFRLLSILENHSATLSELAERQRVSLPTMSNSITFLEERGWVTRRRSSEDRRRVMIEITTYGREVLDEVRQQMETKVAEIVESLNTEERTSVSRGLAILYDAFNSFRESVGRCPHRHE